MKKLILGILAVSLALMLHMPAWAFDSGSTGTDGVFSPTVDTVIDMNDHPDGVYNYSSVSIPAGVTVTFERNANNTPVYWLVQGDVAIQGSVIVNGTTGSRSFPGKGGPGGYDGGYGATTTSYGGGWGLGPGGGPGATSFSGSGGGYASKGSGTVGGATYGNAQIVPFIGGSGGGGGAHQGDTGEGGGGGGGAILIAANGSITVNGTISANGGNGVEESRYNCHGGYGSGGAIKLLADVVTGSGSITAIGASGWYVYGGSGRIRIEANEISLTQATSPGYSAGVPISIFYADLPTLAISSIGGIPVPSVPTGTYATPDVTIPATISDPLSIDVKAGNIAVGTSITVRAVPMLGQQATATATLSGSYESSSATVELSLSREQMYVLSVDATVTLQTAMYHDGELIQEARITSGMDSKSSLVYLTTTGREIKPEELLATVIWR